MWMVWVITDMAVMYARIGLPLDSHWTPIGLHFGVFDLLFELLFWFHFKTIKSKTDPNSVYLYAFHEWFGKSIPYSYSYSEFNELNIQFVWVVAFNFNILDQNIQNKSVFKSEVQMEDKMLHLILKFLCFFLSIIISILQASKLKSTLCSSRIYRFKISMFTKKS